MPGSGDISITSDNTSKNNPEQRPGLSAEQHRKREGLFTVGGGQPSNEASRATKHQMEQQRDSDEEYMYEKDSARTAEKESRKNEIRIYYEKYRISMAKMQVYQRRHGSLKYKFSREPKYSLGNTNEHEVSDDIKFHQLNMNGLLYDLDDARKSKEEFEKTRGLIDHRFLEYKIKIETLEYFANHLDTENPPVED